MLDLQPYKRSQHSRISVKMWNTRLANFFLITRFTFVITSMSDEGFLAERKLKEYLFPPTFDPYARPVRDIKETITILVDMSLYQLVDLNERLQVLQSSIWIRLYWTDPQLRWNISDYDNVTTIYVPPSAIWTPDIVIYNEVGLEKGDDPLQFQILVNNDGSVAWLHRRIVETSCTLNVYQFPYDSQKCIFKFGSWAMSYNELDVKNKSGRGEGNFYIDNGEWSLVDIDVERHEVYYPCCKHPYPDVTFTVTLQRRSLYYIYNIMVPCVLITMLHLTAFLLPAESGEKISLNVTILLGLTVFLLLVAEILPPQSFAIPVVGQYFGVCVFVVSLSTAANVFILHLHFRGSRGFPVPRWVHSLIIGKLGYILCYGKLISENLKSRDEKRSNKTTIKDPHTMAGKTNVEIVSIKDKRGKANENVSNGHVVEQVAENAEVEPPVNQSLHRYDNHTLISGGLAPMTGLGVLRRQIEDKEEDKKAIIEDWILVSLVLDRFFFVLFGIIDVLGVTLVFIFCGQSTSPSAV